MKWFNVQTLATKEYKCGFCGSLLVSDKGYIATNGMAGNQSRTLGSIYICHQCEKPSFFDLKNEQTPGPIIGTKINHIPDENVENLFAEAKKCFSISAFTSSVMCCRKLLMNIAVSEGASEGLSFVEYVNYLNDSNYIPPKGKLWVDSIRKLGNDANHKIEFKTKEEANRIIVFSEMLLKFIYELPGIMNDSNNKPQ